MESLDALDEMPYSFRGMRVRHLPDYMVDRISRSDIIAITELSVWRSHASTLPFVEAKTVAE